MIGEMLRFYHEHIKDVRKIFEKRGYSMIYYAGADL